MNLVSSSWTQNFFKGWVLSDECAPQIPDQDVKEAKLLFQHQVVSIVEDDEIPESLIMNFDQSPMKYAPVSNSTLAKQGSKHIPITGGAFKKSIAATFGITY